MNRQTLVALAVLPAMLIGLSACGDPNRSALAKQTVQKYWYDIGHLKLDQAYALLSPGNQADMPRSTFRSNMFGFLTGTAGVNARVGHVDLVGDCALVAVGLESPKVPGGYFNAYQHLYWLNGHWRITESNGGLTKTVTKLTSCPTGT